MYKAGDEADQKDEKDKMTPRTQFISGLCEISERYDAYIIDQWGVLHDGKILYSKTLEAMSFLRDQNKKCIMLSNSSKRKENSVKGLKKVGLDPLTLFDDIITSGELAWEAIQQRNDPIFSLQNMRGDGPMRAFVFGNDQDDEEYCRTCGCAFASAQECDFILARGIHIRNINEMYMH